MSEPTPHKKSGLMLRVVSALIMLPIAIFIILQGGVVYIGLVSILSILILYEWNAITRDKPMSLIFLCQSVCLFYVILTVSGYLELDRSMHQYIQLGFIGGFVALAYFCKACMRFLFLGMLYTLLPAISLLWLRQYGDNGGLIVLWVMIIVWSMDTGAYFAGKNIGGPKMAPKISPNKTWAGLVGGTVTAVVLGLIAAHYFNFDFGVMVIIPVAAALAIWSQMGDLAESALKRHFDVKDSGAIIPGHGGIMDRVDGIVFAAPAAAYFLYLAGAWV